MSPNALILFNVQLWSVHASECIDIIFSLLEENKRVFVILCTGALSSCAANPHHNEDICSVCRQRTNYYLRLLAHKNVTFVELNFDQFDLSSYSKISQQIDKATNFLEIGNIYYNSTPIGLLSLSQVFDDYNDSYGDLSKDLKKHLQKLIINGAMLFDYGTQFINDHSIDEVYVWNGRRPSDGPLLYAAKELQKQYFSFICGGSLGTIQILNSTGIHLYQDVIKEVKKLSASTKEFLGSKRFNRLAYNVAKSYIQGGSTAINQGAYLSNIGIRESFSIDDYRLDPSKETILILTSSPAEIIYLEGVYTDLGIDPYRTMLECANDEKIIDNYNVIVRWHPLHKLAGANEQKSISNHISNFSDFIHIDPVSKVDTYSILSHVKYVVSYISSVNLWAAIMGIEVLSFGVGASYYGDGLSRKFAAASDIKSFLLKEKPTDHFDFRKSLDLALEYSYWRRYSGSVMKHIHYIESSDTATTGWFATKNKTFVPI